MYGLVAPGYEQAETAVATLAEDESSFTGADLSTKLKLLGVDVASFGDAHGTAGDCLDVIYSDSRSGLYKKLVIGRDGTLLGGILVGDAEAYGMLKAFTGSVPPVSPSRWCCRPARARPCGSARPRCRTTRSSAPATTSARARSARPSPSTTAPPCPR
ncbi:hypothetical protein SHKM778_76760 [Streptomyces sp. KM77-8]|uniref:NADH-rubredoxin oxidoreductase C-terminal domain-containing protein n=1 Tax=Streptomyces haneummycinicus TaxID=3074435 RepID=A0AAT9HVJ0_9ACTN